MRTLLLVRHGQTAWNRDERFRGQADIPLDDVGMEQARRTGRFIAARWSPVAIYASPLSRAMQTAQAIAEACGGPSVQPVPALTDINYGAWVGLSVPEVEARYPDDLRLWQQEPARGHPTGGESLHALQERSVAALRALLAQHADDATLIVVGHTVLNRALMLGLLGMNLNHFWQLGQDPCAINVLDERPGRFSLRVLNLTVHLEG